MLPDLEWTADSNYLLGRSRSDITYRGGIHLWNATSGRHVADFVGLPSSDAIRDGLGPLRLSDHGKKLVCCAPDGQLHLWDFEQALEEIRADEAAKPRQK
jgi:WD40 repeat protein